MIDISCRRCGARFRVKESTAGKWVRCKECNCRIDVPAPVAMPYVPPELAKPPRSMPVAEMDDSEEAEEQSNSAGLTRKQVALLVSVCIVLLASVGIAALWHLHGKLSLTRMPLSPAEAAIERGRASLGRLNNDLALECYDEAIRLEPGRADFYVERAECLISKHRFQEAQDDYARALKLDPANWQANVASGVYFAIQNDLSRAVNHLEAASTARAPEDQIARITSILRDHASTLADEGQLAVRIIDAQHAEPKLNEATEYISAAMRFSPRDAKALVAAAKVAVARRRPDEAVEWCNKALQIDRKAAGAYFFRGAAMAQKGDREEAQRDYERARDVDRDLEFTQDRGEWYFHR